MGFAYDNFPSQAISEEDISQIKEALGRDLVYELEVAPIKSRWLVQLSEANWYNCEISIYEQYEDMTSTSIYELIAFEHNGEVTFFEESSEFIASATFLDSIKESFVLRDEISIEDFELALDQINDYERKEKARFERNGLFVFIRKEPFDEGRGFIVRTNDHGIIAGIEYSNEIPLEGV
ncbi:MAG: hypothetical protein EOM67_15415, partial [Spirochaetia bacterium]|nr:hypothetical protein [Spirochaetia bacterium]